ncbi:quinone oxidoreductase family protein [Fluviicola taffensis]|uniref:NADPH:quinone reductase n=1 Tax=Fluviicola taffensis (strain DSM 16823 / NCIMB 13979 / RW262) TaxID=755732 RepID=F2IEF1_FLUTR|nr:zinc-binding dehydrogenase [Fluviicola taffensis]AEA43475.1 NADPH:quinone reductase [Fluviicola taffensis DSM 16823]
MKQSQAFQLVKKGSANNAFALNNVTLPELKGKQVLIKVEAFGLNYADVMARLGLYREAPPMPCVIGYEVVGIVSEIGNDVDPDLLGKRVVGFCRFGGYAKDVITEEYAVSVIDSMDTGIALSLATQFVTAYYMVNYSANVQSDERVLIHAAAGGVGTALIQLCKHKGAHVIAKVSSKEKEQLVLRLGADEVINYKESDYATQISARLKTERLDVSFNPVAGTTFKKDWSLLGTGGRMVLFGGSELSNGKWGILSTLNFVRKMGFVVPIGLMMRSKSIIGINMLKVADFKPSVITKCLNEVVQLVKDGKIHPVVGGVYKEGELALAHQLLEEGKTVGKLIIEWDEQPN